MFTGKLPFPADTVQESMILRLTDRPKQLLEMKSDVAWPPDVQAVMDKALERDVNLRYQTASEFGRALHKAISSMPEATVTNAFTSVMGRMSTPKKPAAVVPPSPNASGGMTRPMPATRVNESTPGIERPTLVRPEKSKAPIFGGIAAVLVIGAIGAYLAFRPGTNNAQNSDGSAIPSGQQTGAPQPPPAVKLASVLAVADSLSDFTRDATGVTATRALAILDSVAPLAQEDSDKVYIDYLRGQAHLMISGDAKSESVTAQERKAGCNILLRIEGKSRSRQFERSVKFYLYGDSAKNIEPPCRS
jgi:hypothetical protein